MRAASIGWRTRASQLRASGVAAGAGTIAPPMWTAPRAPLDGAAEPVLEGPPWAGVQWTLVLVGFLAYIWTVTTYAIAIGDVAMAAAILGLIFQDKPFRLPPVLVVFGLFVLWGVFGLVHTDYPDAVERRLDILWKLWLIALVAVNALRDRPRIRLFVFVFLAAYAMYPIRGALFNYFLGGHTVNGRAVWNVIYANPNDLAALTLFPLAMSAGFFVSEKKGWPKYAALAGIVVTAAVIMLTGSRGALLAMAAVGLLIVAGGRKRLKTIAGVAVVTGILVLAAPPEVRNRVAGLRTIAGGGTEELGAIDDQGSAEQRFAFWQVAWAVSRDNLALGVGIGAYPKANAVYSQSTKFSPVARGERDAHSTYLTVLAETGLVGFGLFATMFGMVLLRAERLRRRARDVLPRAARQVFFIELGIVGYFLAGIFGSFAQLSFPYIYLALLWCMTELLSEELQRVGMPVGSDAIHHGRAVRA